MKVLLPALEGETLMSMPEPCLFGSAGWFGRQMRKACLPVTAHTTTTTTTKMGGSGEELQQASSRQQCSAVPNAKCLGVFMLLLLLFLLRPGHPTTSHPLPVGRGLILCDIFDGEEKVR